MPPPPPPDSSAAPPPVPGPPASVPAATPTPVPARAGGPLVLLYTPDGPVGGTFTCLVCAAQAWQPDLLDHTPACPHRLQPQAAPPARR